jgi:transposase-like protein
MAETRLGAVAQTSGRTYWRETDARAVVEAWRTSGLSLAEFSRKHGIHVRRLARWARKLGAEAREPTRFHPVRLRSEPQEADGLIEVVLDDGARIRLGSGFAAADLSRVLDVLQARA